MSGVYDATEESLPVSRRRSRSRFRQKGRGVNVVPDAKDGDRPEVEKLPRHRWFEPERIPASERAQAVVDDVLNQVQNYEKYYSLRKRARKQADQLTFEAMVTAVVSDLMFNHVSGEEPGIAITRSKTKLGRKSRYSSPVMGKRLPALLDQLCTPEMDFLRQEKGSQEYFKDNRATTIYPTNRLVSRIEVHEVQVDDLATQKYRETIVLKRPKNGPLDSGGYIEYDDTKLTRQYRAEMEKINQYLQEANVDFDDSVRSDKIAADVRDHRLRRVFTNGGFESGGRRVGGFWQPLSKIQRREGLTIDDEPVLTLDYSQMALRIAYGEVRAEPPSEDGYVLPGFEEYREAVKMIFNSALCCDKRPSRAPKGTREHLPKKIAFMQVLMTLEAHHGALIPLLYRGEGHRIQFLESQILVAVLLELQRLGIVSLPIHDAVIVAESAADRAKEVMEGVFQERTGVRAIVAPE